MKERPTLNRGFPCLVAPLKGLEINRGLDSVKYGIRSRLYLVVGVLAAHT